MKITSLTLPNIPQQQAERFAYTESAIASASQQGAQLIVLPAHFNGIYAYDERLAHQTETLDGATFAFLQAQSRTHEVYLAGAFILMDTGNVTMSAFIVAPDGRSWRYDQAHPFLWERASYRDGAHPHIAHTPLGRIGMLIGWDVAYADPWALYVGRVDMILCMSALPDMSASRLIAPDGIMTYLHQLGTPTRKAVHAINNALKHLPDFARWVNVPVICASLTGRITTHLPAPRYSAHLLCLGRGDILPGLGETYTFDAPLYPLTAIFTHNTTLTPTDGVIHTEINPPPAIRPLPQGTPPPDLPAMLRDVLFPLVHSGLTLNYQRITRRQWGARMAQTDAKTRIMRVFMLIVALVATLFGFLLGKSRR